MESGFKEGLTYYEKTNTFTYNVIFDNGIKATVFLTFKDVENILQKYLISED